MPIRVGLTGGSSSITGERAQIRRGIHVVQCAQHDDTPPGEVRQRVGQRVLGGPAHRGERPRRPARRHRRPANSRRPPPDRTLPCALPSARNAACASCGPASGMSQPMIATRPRGNRRKARCMRTPRSPSPCASRRTRTGRRNRAWSGVTASTRAEAPVGGQCAQQPGQRRDVEPQRRAVADLARQPPLHRAQPRGTGEHHHRVPHP